MTAVFSVNDAWVSGWSRLVMLLPERDISDGHMFLTNMDQWWQKEPREENSS